jgi:hypothetical protein
MAIAKNLFISSPQSGLRVSASQGGRVFDQMNRRLRQALVAIFAMHGILKTTLGRPAKLSRSLPNYF